MIKESNIREVKTFTLVAGSQPARFYIIEAKISQGTFSTNTKPLHVQHKISHREKLFSCDDLVPILSMNNNAKYLLLVMNEL